MTEKNQIGMEDKKDRLSKYEPYPPLEKVEQTPQLIKPEADYQAVEEFKSRKSPRFRIVDADGKSYGCSYAHLLDWIFEPPALLTINTATRVFTFQGKRLEYIERLLMEERIKVIREFNSKQYKPPPKNKTIINELTITEV